MRYASRIPLSPPFLPAGGKERKKEKRRNRPRSVRPGTTLEVKEDIFFPSEKENEGKGEEMI